MPQGALGLHFQFTELQVEASGEQDGWMQPRAAEDCMARRALAVGAMQALLHLDGLQCAGKARRELRRTRPPLLLLAQLLPRRRFQQQQLMTQTQGIDPAVPTRELSQPCSRALSTRSVRAAQGKPGGLVPVGRCFDQCSGWRVPTSAQELPHSGGAVHASCDDGAVICSDAYIDACVAERKALGLCDENTRRRRQILDRREDSICSTLAARVCTAHTESCTRARANLP